MRAPILAAAAALALASPAEAQLGGLLGGGGGGSGVAQEVTQLLSWAKQAADMAAQARQLRSQYDATARLAGSGGVAAALGGLSRTTGPEASRLPGMAAGRETWGTADSFVAENRRYMPMERDAWTERMRLRERTTANAQAIAEEALRDTDRQIADLAALQAQIDGAGTVVDAGVINAQLAGHRQNLALNSAKLEQARMMMAAQDRVEAQQQEQLMRESTDRLLERTRGAADALGFGIPSLTARPGARMGGW